MPIGDDSEDTPPEDAHLSLAAGLKCCRAVVDNYRSLLSDNAAMQLFRFEASEPPVSPPEEL